MEDADGEGQEREDGAQGSSARERGHEGGREGGHEVSLVAICRAGCAARKRAATGETSP